MSSEDFDYGASALIKTPNEQPQSNEDSSSLGSKGASLNRTTDTFVNVEGTDEEFPMQTFGHNESLSDNEGSSTQSQSNLG